MKSKEIMSALEEIKAVLAEQTRAMNTVLWLLLDNDEGDDEPAGKIFSDSEVKLLVDLERKAN